LNERLATRLIPASILAILVSTVVNATLVEPMSLSERVERADHVVLARAERVHVVTDPGTRFHYTVTRFVVIDEAKGELGVGESFELRLIGGHAPGSHYETVVSDVPRFSEGEELVLFTKRAEGGGHLLVGLDGAVRLHGRTIGSGKVVATPTVERGAFSPEALSLTPASVRRAGKPAATVPRQPRERDRVSSPSAMSADAFLEQVREIVASQREGSR
jgi:hypothetical protein